MHLLTPHTAPSLQSARLVRDRIVRLIVRLIVPSIAPLGSAALLVPGMQPAAALPPNPRPALSANALNPITFNRPKLPTPNRPKTGLGRAGAGRSSSCNLAQRPTTLLMALAPNYGTPQKPQFWAQTSQVRPTLWFYTPYHFQTPTEVELTLFADVPLAEDRRGVVLSKMRQTVSAPGLIGFTPLPSPLVLNPQENYRWQLSVLCKPGDAMANPTITGAITRTQVTKQPHPSDRAAALTLAQQGLWLDTLSLMVQLRTAQPNNSAIAADWKSLLKETGLSTASIEEIVKQPVKAAVAP